MIELLATVVDDGSWNEYKAEFGRSLVCAYARIGGWPCGVVANQRKLTQKKMPGGKAGPSTAVNMPAVIYDDSADKAARFIMDCNQRRLPIVFVHDTSGFMVGRDSEQGGIIRAGAKMVNAMANCIVPKIALIVGGSYGAGNYAMCGKAYDPRLIVGWPSAQVAVMGGEQASKVMLQIEVMALKGKGEEITPEKEKELLQKIRAKYEETISPYYAASRLWLDAIIDPIETRTWISMGIEAAAQAPATREFNMGVLQT